MDESPLPCFVFIPLRLLPLPVFSPLPYLVYLSLYLSSLPSLPPMRFEVPAFSFISLFTTLLKYGFFFIPCSTPIFACSHLSKFYISFPFFSPLVCRHFLPTILTLPCRRLSFASLLPCPFSISLNPLFLQHNFRIPRFRIFLFISFSTSMFFHCLMNRAHHLWLALSYLGLS